MKHPSALFVTTVPITLEAFLVPFAQHFRAQGWRVDALANSASSHAPIESAFDARFDVAWSRNPIDPRNLVGSASVVRRVVHEGDYDLVHVHTPIAAFVTRWALRSVPSQKRPVVIYTAHGFHFYEGQRRLPHALYRSLERRAARWTDYLVTINAEDEAAARALGTLTPERIRLIPGVGVDMTTYDAGAVSAKQVADVRSVLGVRPHAFVLTMVAEFSAVKRHRHILQALSLVRSARVALVLVGDGPLESEVREQVVALGLSEPVRFAGYRRDIPLVLAASDALILASEREGLNRSVLEAMACGKPVIGTASRGIADAVTPQTGWIVPKNDAAALAAAIDEAASDTHEACRRGQAGRTRAQRLYALPHIIAAHEELYREALASRV